MPELPAGIVVAAVVADVKGTEVEGVPIAAEGHREPVAAAYRESAPK